MVVGYLLLCRQVFCLLPLRTGYGQGIGIVAVEHVAGVFDCIIGIALLIGYGFVPIADALQLPVRPAEINHTVIGIHNLAQTVILVFIHDLVAQPVLLRGQLPRRIEIVKYTVFRTVYDELVLKFFIRPAVFRARFQRQSIRAQVRKHVVACIFAILHLI